MNPETGREFLFKDEWRGIYILLVLMPLARFVHPFFWWMFGLFGVPWAVAVYIIGYPMQWKNEKWWRDFKVTELGLLSGKKPTSTETREPTP